MIVTSRALPAPHSHHRLCSFLRFSSLNPLAQSARKLCSWLTFSTLISFLNLSSIWNVGNVPESGTLNDSQFPFRKSWTCIIQISSVLTVDSFTFLDICFIWQRVTLDYQKHYRWASPGEAVCWLNKPPTGLPSSSEPAQSSEPINVTRLVRCLCFIINNYKMSCEESNSDGRPTSQWSSVWLTVCNNNITFKNIFPVLITDTCEL